MGGQLEAAAALPTKGLWQSRGVSPEPSALCLGWEWGGGCVPQPLPLHFFTCKPGVLRAPTRLTVSTNAGVGLGSGALALAVTVPGADQPPKLSVKTL